MFFVVTNQVAPCCKLHNNQHWHCLDSTKTTNLYQMQSWYKQHNSQLLDWRYLFRRFRPTVPSAPKPCQTSPTTHNRRSCNFCSVACFPIQITCRKFCQDEWNLSICPSDHRTTHFWCTSPRLCFRPGKRNITNCMSIDVGSSDFSDDWLNMTHELPHFLVLFFNGLRLHFCLQSRGSRRWWILPKEMAGVPRQIPSNGILKIFLQHLIKCNIRCFCKSRKRASRLQIDRFTSDTWKGQQKFPGSTSEARWSRIKISNGDTPETSKKFISLYSSGRCSETNSGAKSIHTRILHCPKLTWIHLFLHEVIEQQVGQEAV